MRKDVVAFFIVSLMMIVPFTSCSIIIDNSEGDINQVVEQLEVSELDNEDDTAIGNPIESENSNLFYDDGNGMLWMFHPIGGGSAAITGGWISSLEELNVPRIVVDNRYLSASATITIEQNKGIDGMKDYAVLQVNVKKYNAVDYSTRYLNINFSERADGKSIAFDDLGSTAGSDWIELSSGKTITISGIQSIRIANSYHCDSECNKTEMAIKDGKGNEKRVIASPKCTISSTKIDTIQKEGGGSYNVSTINDNAFNSSVTSRINVLIGLSDNGLGSFNFNSNSIKTIFIPNTITKIGDYAFWGFSSLRKLVFENESKLKTIGTQSFFDCGPSKLYEMSDDCVSEVLISDDNWKQLKESGIKCEQNLSITIKAIKDFTNTKDKDNSGMYVYHGSIQANPKFNVGPIAMTEFYQFKEPTKSESTIFEYNYSFTVEDGVWVSGGNKIMCGGNGHQYYIRIPAKTLSESQDGEVRIKIEPADGNYLSVEIPSSVESIGDRAFNNVQKLSFQTGSNLQYLGSNAFQKLNFPVQFPNTIKSFGINPINYCSGISFEGQNEGQVRYIDGFLVNGTELISYLGNKAEITADDFVNKGIKTVADYAFKCNVNVSSVVIPQGVKWGLFPFYGCTSLKTIDISGIVDVPDYLFGYSGLESVTIPANIVSIGQKAFYNIETLETVLVDKKNKLSTIGQFSFSLNKKLKTITFDSSEDTHLCTINEYAFFGCNSLGSVLISDGFNLQYIGDGAFAKHCMDGAQAESLSAISFGKENEFIIPREVRFIGDMAFAYISAALSFSDEPGRNMLNSIPVALSLDAGFSKIVFSSDSQITSIGENAFARMKGVQTVDLAGCGALESIGSNAFKSSTILDVKFPDSGRLKQVLGFSSDDVGGLIESWVVPSYVEEAGLLSLFTNVSFEAGSRLKSYRCDSGCISREGWNDHHTDLSRCTMLQHVSIYGDVTLPAGVYAFERYQGTIRNSDQIAKLNDGRINITKESIVVNNKSFGSAIISLDPENPYFKMEDGCLICVDGEERVMVGVSSDVTSVTLSEDSDVTRVADGAFKGNVDTLIIDKEGIDLGSSLFDGNDSDVVNVFILNNSIQSSTESFKGGYSRACFYVDKDSDWSLLFPLGQIYLGSEIDGGYVFFPTVAVDTDTSNIVEFKIKDADSQKHIQIEMSGGYTQYDLVFSTGLNAVIPVLDYKSLDLSNIDFHDSRYVVAEASIKPRQTGECVAIVFDGNGGSLSGMSQETKNVAMGLTLIDSDFPVFTRTNSDLIGWMTGSGDDYDANAPLEKDLSLYAKWQTRNPLVIIETDAGEVRYNGKAITSMDVAFNSSVILSFAANKGYDVRNWVVDGVERDISASNELTLSNIQKDCKISVTYSYYSQSSGLNPISYKGLPTTETIGKAVQAWTAGGFVDHSGAVWKGHASVPLIVDEYVFIRVGDFIYKLESDTGYVIGYAQSRSAESYYHQLGYGNGLIVDALTGRVYDTDLNLKFKVIGSFTGVEYHDGFFYTSGTALYRFSSNPNISSSGTVVMEYVGDFDRTVFSSYGFSSSVFVDDYIYRVFAQGNSRGIAAMNINDDSDGYGETSSVVLEAIQSMYLDDGWISYNDGVLYLPGYTRGLFGAIATSGFSALSYVNVDGLQFSRQGSYVFTETMNFVSEFVVSDGYGFVNAGAALYVFKMNDDGTPSAEPVAVCESALSHGSITLEKAYSSEENGFLTYIYLIPYRTGSNEIVVLSGQETDNRYELKRTISTNFLLNYNSQAMRADDEGRMVWYNDSGQIYSYTTPEKNRFFFFIDDGSNATWYESYGASAAEALELLGSDIVTLSKSNSLLTVNGSNVEDKWDIYYLKKTISDATTSQGVSESDKTNWIGIDNLYDRSLNVYHYYIITSTDVPVVGSEYSYISRDGTETYSFADNVGNRSIVGKKMVKGTEDVVTIRFYDRGTEVKGSALIGIVGTDVKGSLPMVYRTGHIGYWVEAGSDEIVSSLSGTKYTEDKRYEMKWIEASVNYTISMDAVREGGQIFLNLTTMRTKGSEDLPDAHILLVSTYDKGVVVNSYTDKLNMVDGTAHAKLGISQSHLVSAHAFIVNGTPAVGSFMNYGMSVFDPAG